MYLNCHSYFSFRYGTLSAEDLVAEAAAKGIEALALTDINNTSAVFPFYTACREKGIKPLVGIDFRWAGSCYYIALARNAKGFCQMNEYLSAYLQIKEAFPIRPPMMSEVYIIYPWECSLTIAPDELEENEFIGIRPSQLAQLGLSNWSKRLERVVMLHPVSFKDKAGFQTHKLLRAINSNTILSKLSAESLAHTEEVMLEVDQLLTPYRAYPQLIYNTMRLVEECNFDFQSGTSKNKISFTGSREDDRLLLNKLAEDGWRNRYNSGKEAKQRMLHELEVIDKLDFATYFLITWDIIRYANNRGFRHVGRGSGANSIVAYCMKITDVDPIGLDLYFERFINPHRSSPPDFDIDFSWDERDDVTDYVFKRYGRRHTALLATYNTFKGRSIIRELGKVFGLPKMEIDKLVANPGDPSLQDNVSRAIFKYGQRIANFPNHLSIHAGGVLISEEPIYQYTATELPPKGFPITQFDMYVAEEVGLYKYDILSQRGLGHIKDTVELVAENKGLKVDVDKVEEFKVDPNLNERLKVGDTIGCFYIESPAMRQLLGKLGCGDYITLVAASSIIRPGVAKSGMMREYIQRFHAPDSFEYLHPKMKELMEETFGVMVYQEDVIKVAHHFAGIDLADADILRRAMSGKYRSKDGFLKIRDKFFRNCEERGYPPTIASEVWRQMESFSGYSFSKAHSASFAVESYQSLYLKTYFPHEFMVGVINNFGGFYRTEFYVNEARQSGANVHAPCVNSGQQLTCISGKDIYLGFIHVKSLERGIAKRITPERIAGGDFEGIENFVKRLSTTLEQVNILIRVGAFRFTGKSKKSCLWEAAMLFGQESGKRSRVRKQELFQLSPKSFSLPDLVHTSAEDAYDELELLGFPLCSPFEMLEKPLGQTVIAKELTNYFNKRVRIGGYLVCTKNVRTSNGGEMRFGNFLDSDGKLFDTVHFPPSLKRYPFHGLGVYLMYGKVVDDFGIPSLEVEKMYKMRWVKDPRYVMD